MEHKRTDLENVSTRDLVEELKKREGVEVEEYGAYEMYQTEGEGPAIILIVTD